MLGNIWLSSALIVAAMYSASSIYKSYDDIQEAKQIHENYEIILEIKSLLAAQYNRNTEAITRAEIIMHLPSGANWEKVLLLNRNTSSTDEINALDFDALMDQEGEIVLSEDEKVKLLALRSKLKNITNISSTVNSNDEYSFNIGNLENNLIQKDKIISRKITYTIECLADDILYVGTSLTSLELKGKFNTCISNNIPSDAIYHDLNTTKEDYFKERVLRILSNQNSPTEVRLYLSLKDL